jgi:hypothetical protein
VLLKSGQKRKSSRTTDVFPKAGTARRNFRILLLPIEKDREGRPEVHYDRRKSLWDTRIYSAFRRWEADGCMAAIFAGTVLKLHRDELLDITVIHGDGTTTAAKKGGDNLGFSGHKKFKGDKVVAFCDRNCNVIAPFVSAPGN